MALPAAVAAIIPDIVKAGSELLSRVFPDEQAKEKAHQQYELELQSRLQAAWDSEQRNITERHANDMQSDSWLSKNIRPMALIYLMVLFTLAFFLDVPETLLELLRDLLMTAFIFYFGSRTLEKSIKIFKGGK